MKRRKQERGITLIALIITIVVLLILAVVAINSIQNEGLIAHATNSTGTYNNAVTNEQGILSEYEEFLKQHSCTEHNFENGVCSKCGYSQCSAGGHILVDNTEQWSKCKICNQYCAHQLKNVEWNGGNYETHYALNVECALCNLNAEYYEESHNFDEDYYCATCKTSCSHDHTERSYTYVNDETHMVYESCFYCSYEGTYEENHGEGNTWTETEGCSVYCSGCGNLVGSDHYWSNGQCEYCGAECQHNWSNGTCTKCRISSESACSHETTETKYSYWGCETCYATTSCKTCGLELESSESGHNYVDGKCTLCLGECGHDCCGLSDVESCEYGDEYSCVGVGTCGDCGLEGATHNYEHNWSYGKWTANGMEGCSTTRTCSQCNHSETYTQAHQWNMDICRNCGKDCEHDWSEIDENGMQWCYICGCN